MKKIWLSLSLIAIGASACVCHPAKIVANEIQNQNVDPEFREVPSSGLDKEIRNEVVLKIAAKPNKGFNYPYYLYIPESAFGARTPTLLVQPSNTGTSDDDLSVHDKAMRKRATRGYQVRVAKRISSPLLIPVFPRPRRDNIYVHYLNRKTMLIKEGPIARPDLQLIAMVEDARALLASTGLEIQPKIFLDGFSASAGFTLKFTALHPEYVKAATAGGVNAMPILPVGNWKGTTLPFPIGISDLKAISGSDFNLRAWLQVPQFIYMGELDTNDTVPFRDSWDEKEAALINKLFGDKMIPGRWNNVQEVFRSVGSKAEFQTYRQIGHTVTLDIENDLVKFFSGHDNK